MNIHNQTFMKKVESEFQQTKQWFGMQSWELFIKHKIKLECLIEILEIESCGSVGGFDDKQPSDSRLGKRFLWVCKKQNVELPKELHKNLDFCNKRGV